MNELKISVLLVSYNPFWDKMRRTLFSIVKQRNVDFDLVIADDGSKVSCADKIREYLNSKNFTNYTIIENKENQGTVKNILSGALAVKGDYIKLISPGDFLATDTTLEIFVNFLTKNPCTLCFGKAIYYSNGNDLRVDFKGQHPFLLAPYIKCNKKKIFHNYLITRDAILGAAVTVSVEKLRFYLRKIENLVKYCEDSMINLMVAEEETICFLDDYVVHYECDSGISTSNADFWQKIIYEENKNIFTFLLQEKKISKLIYLENFSDSILQRKILKILLDFKNILLKRYLRYTQKNFVLKAEEKVTGYLTEILQS